MKIFTRRWITLSICICLLLLLPGCWDYESIATRASLIGIGIDPAGDDPQQVQVTVQFPILMPGGDGGMSSGSGDSSAKNNNKTLSTEAYSISEAMKQLQLKVDRQIDTAQLQAIVFSSKLSSDMMNSVVGQLIRLPKMNRLANVFTTPESAKDVLSTTGTDAAPMDFLDKSMTYRQQGFAIRRQLWEYWRDATQVGVVPVLPMVEPVQSEDKSEGALMLGGITVYLNNQAAFTLSRQETFYVNLLRGKVRSMAVDAPIHEGIVSLTDVRSNSRLRCIGEGKNLLLVDRVSVRATLGKLVDPTPKPLPPSNLNKIESETSEYLTQQLTSTLKKLQQQKADICGFGGIYFQHHPDEEQRMKEQWGQMFQHAKIDIQVNVVIVSRGMLI